MYEYYNAHPEGKHVGDCVKRAITIASGMPYKEVSRELNRYKKITGAKTFNERKNCDAYVEKVLHGVKYNFPAQAGRPRMNGERFCKLYSKGNYILNMAGHWSVCVNGVIKDTWNPEAKCVYSAWKIEPHLLWYTVEKNLDSYTVRMRNGDYTIFSDPLKRAEMKAYVKCLHDLGYKEYT